jgi:crossover junction endodeoxyribonuclease RuvC
MRVLALDPGYDRLGVAVLEKDGGKESLLFSSCIVTDSADSISDRLLAVGRATVSLLTEYKPGVVAVETLFFNRNAKSAIGVAQARGIILYLAKQAGCKLCEFGPQEVKVAVTGYGKSDKSAVISMVKKLIKNTPDSAYDDEYDAIAVGITALAHHRQLL